MPCAYSPATLVSMKAKRTLALAAFLSLAPVAIYAGAPHGDPAAWNVARQVEAHYRDVKTLQAQFLETYRAGQDDIRVESGAVYFRRPGLMRWNYESPHPKLFLVDGHHVWFYIPADHSASRSSVRQSSDWRTPFALLTGKARFQDLCASMTIVPSQGGPGAPPADHVVLDCRPKNRNDFLDARIEADASHRVVRVRLRQPGDVETEVSFGDWHENIPLAKSLFLFTPPPGVTVVDQEALAGEVH